MRFLAHLWGSIDTPATHHLPSDRVWLVERVGKRRFGLAHMAIPTELQGLFDRMTQPDTPGAGGFGG